MLSNIPVLNTRLASLRASFPTAVMGPDLYAYYNANQSLIGGDNIHPTDPDGYAAYRQLWADALVTNVYNATSSGVLVHRAKRLHVGAIQ